MPAIDRHFHFEPRAQESDVEQLFDLFVGKKLVAELLVRKQKGTKRKAGRRIVRIETTPGFGEGFDVVLARGVIWMGAQKAQEIANTHQEIVEYYPLQARMPKVKEWQNSLGLNTTHSMYPEKE